MNSSRKSLLLAALGCMTVVVGFGQAPVKAQVNALQQLTSQMIGSSFEEEFSTSLPGTSSLVDGGSGNINRVMTNLVDSEIRRRPAPVAQDSISDRGPKTVQLLVPVKTGLEFRDIQALIPRAKILEMSRRVFVLVAETARALPAYQLGRKLQSQLGFIFELAYSEGHPDLNLAWLSSINGSIAKAPKVDNPNQVKKQIPKVSSKIQTKVVAGTAEDLQGLSFSSPFMADQSASSSRSVDTVSSNITIEGSHDFRVVEHKSPETSSEPSLESVITSSTGASQDQSISIVLAENIVPQNTDLHSNQSSVGSKSRSSISEVLSELRAMSQVSSEPAEKLAENSEDVLPLSAKSSSIESSPAESISSVSSFKLAEKEANNTALSDKIPSSLDDVIAELKSIRPSKLDSASKTVNLASSSSESEKQPGFLEVSQTPVKISKSDPQFVDSQAQESVSIDFSSQPTASSSSIDDVLAELKSMSSSLIASSISVSHNSFSGSSSVSAAAQKLHESPSLVKAVPIQPISLGNIPVVSSRYIAANQHLAYVYVKVQRESQIATLKNISNSPVVHYHRGELLARVGIYRDTALGQRLQRNQLQRLSNAGFEVQVIANNANVVNNFNA